MTFSFKACSFELAEVLTKFPADVTASVDTGVLSTFACWLKDSNLDAAYGQAREPPVTHTHTHTHCLLLFLSYTSSKDWTRTKRFKGVSVV
jgi:hypothetical protein